MICEVEHARNHQHFPRGKKPPKKLNTAHTQFISDKETPS